MVNLHKNFSERFYSLNKYSNLAVFIYGFFYVLLIKLIAGNDLPFWTDEHHFYDTVKLFAEKPDLYTLKHYPELNTPLPFILYALWGKLAGFSPDQLRIFSLLLAFITIQVLYRFFSLFYTKKIIPASLTVLFTINIYMPGLSYFIYTDMTAILCMLLAAYFYLKKQPFFLFLFLLLAMMSRQYMVFITFAIFLHSLFLFRNKKESSSILYRNIAAVVLSVFAMIPLFVFWGGLSPDNAQAMSEAKREYLSEGIRYNISAAIAYLSNLSVYAAPLVFIFFFMRRKFIQKKEILFASVIALLYFFLPVRASFFAVRDGFPHIGFVHKLLSNHLPLLLVDGFYYLCFTSTLLVLWMSVKDFFISKDVYTLLLLLTIGSFLLFMPFAPIIWEKYLIPVLPFFFLLILPKEIIENRLKAV